MYAQRSKLKDFLIWTSAVTIGIGIVAGMLWLFMLAMVHEEARQDEFRRKVCAAFRPVPPKMRAYCDENEDE